jgi:hypothetical protein
MTEVTEVTEVTQQAATYLVVAFRWGVSNDDFYFVYAGPDGQQAAALAQAERNDRAGKYACVVYKTEAGTRFSQVGYVPAGNESALGYDTLRDVERWTGYGVIIAVDNGWTLLPDPDHERQLRHTDVDVPDWLRIIVAQARWKFEGGVRPGASGSV